MDIIRVEGVAKAYGDHQVHKDLTLAIKKGECFTLLGPSGCGKTVLLRMIAGFESPDAGKIYIDDTLVSDADDSHQEIPPENRGLGVVFQDYAVWPHMTVFDNVAYPLKIAKRPKDEIKKKVMDMIEIVGMHGLEKRLPSELSGGQQQRVALARALVMEPSVLLFDEPLSNLDAKLRIYMRNEIHKIQRKVGITSIYVTHDQSEAMSLSDRIIVMNNGNIEQMGTPHEIYAKPATPFVADFIGMANITTGKVAAVNGDKLTVEFLGITATKSGKGKLQTGDVCKIVTRPEGLKLSRTGAIPCQVISSVFMGESQDYVITAQNQTLQVKEYNPINKEVFAAGENVFLNVDLDSMHLI